MESHWERIEIMLCGGKPWGFSIKGGTENNKSIIVSKLERDGKGEASGLCIGDKIICINDVPIAEFSGGTRKEAVELIKRSGERLVLEIERQIARSPYEMPSRVQSPPFNDYDPDPCIRVPPSVSHRHQGSDEMRRYNNNVQSQYNNSSNNQPAGYVFSKSKGNKSDRKQKVQETLKMVIAEKRESVGNTPPDIIRDRLSDRGRRSVPSSNEQSSNTPTHAGVRHRHGNNKDVERPRSWHVSKHPEMEQEIRNVAPSPSDMMQPVPLTRRKSREWLESGDLRSTLDRKSQESLLSSSSEQLLSENGDNTSYSTRLKEVQHGSHGSSRDRTSINSNPNLMEAVQALARESPGSADYDSSHSGLEQSLYNAQDRSSQDSLNSFSVSTKSYKLECPSSDSKNNVRIEAGMGNKLRSSGRYGVIWKLPQAHRRARSFDALSEDTPRQDRNSQKENIETGGRMSVASAYSDTPTGYRHESASSKSPSPTKIRAETSKDRFIFHRSEKGKNVDLLISNFEKGSTSGQALNSDSKTNSKLTADSRPPNESKSIIKRLQNQHSSSTSNINTKQHENRQEPVLSPTVPDKFHEQSPPPPPASRKFENLFTTDPDYKTLRSRTDEYKKNIQGMSKKVLRVTSFTRKDLELSPPYQSPVHNPKGFRYPTLSVSSDKQNPSVSVSENGNGPVRSKSTSSLLENNMPAVISIPVTREEANLLNKKQYCKSVSPSSSINHINNGKDIDFKKAASEEVFESTKSVTVRKTHPQYQSKTSTELLHCEKRPPGPIVAVNHTYMSISLKSPPALSAQKDHLHIHDIPPRTPTKLPTPPPSLLEVPEEEIEEEEELPPPPPTSLTSLPPPPPTSLTNLPPPPPTSLTSFPPVPPLTLPTQSTTMQTEKEVAEASAASTNSTSTASYSELLSSSSPLPATSAYYQTSASKAKIMNLINQKFDGGETIDLDNTETEEERNRKKIELLRRITQHLSQLQKMKELVKAEITENEQLGKTVKQTAEKLCTARELERFKTFVEEIDKIFNLLFSISGRLTRVKNTLATLPEDADPDEKNGLLEKEKKLTLQREEAISLKENVDRRRETVSKILSSHMNAEQYGDFEHYIKMKTEFISEQRDLDDKVKLAEEQMRELYDSLPESLQDQYPLSNQYEAFLQPLSGSTDKKFDSEKVFS